MHYQLPSFPFWLPRLLEVLSGEPFLGLFFWEPLESSSFLGIVGSSFSRVGDKINPSRSATSNRNFIGRESKLPSTYQTHQ